MKRYMLILSETLERGSGMSVDEIVRKQESSIVIANGFSIEPSGAIAFWDWVMEDGARLSKIVLTRAPGHWVSVAADPEEHTPDGK